MHALVRGQGDLNLGHAVKFYSEWLSSTPYDVGTTTRNGLSKCSKVNPDPSKAYAAAKKGRGATSLSNGALMRIMPLAVWCRNLPSLADV